MGLSCRIFHIEVIWISNQCIKINVYFQGHIIQCYIVYGSFQKHCSQRPFCPDGRPVSMPFHWLFYSWIESRVFFSYINYFIHSTNIYWALLNTRDSSLNKWRLFTQEAYFLVGLLSKYNTKSSAKNRGIFSTFTCFTFSDLIVWCSRDSY